MPLPALPYKRPFYNATLTPHEIEVGLHAFVATLCGARWCSLHLPRQHLGCDLGSGRQHSQEDLTAIMTNTKRGARGARRPSPPPRGGYQGN